MYFYIEQDSPRLSGVPAGQVSHVHISLDGVEISITSQSVPPEVLVSEIDRAIARLTAVRAAAASLTDVVAGARHEVPDVTARVTAPRARAVTTPVTDRVCACGCGQPVTSPRPEARYATGACRVRMHRRRAEET